ncbi:MAG: 7-cyano-7-deazaguanine synthase QueC [Planctomycetes bacterium]|nr:7-cyano-7-deazaguanine synthase QueC [Planctomycetota bacterium]
MKCVALLSGGLDSTVAFALKAKETILALTFDYGQRAASREIHAARAIADHYGVGHRVIELPWLAAVTKSALVDHSMSLPSPDLRDRRAVRESAKVVWVPNRNGAMINIAASLAESMGADTILAGFNKEEGATFPDNTPAYLAAATRALWYSTANHVKVAGPTARWDKKRIVREGRRIGAPLDLIWPCYEGEAEWCRRCESCLRSLRALEEAQPVQRK